MSDYEKILEEIESRVSENTEKEEGFYYKEIIRIDQWILYGCFDTQSKKRGLIIRYPNTEMSYSFPPKTRGFTVSDFRPADKLNGYQNLLLSVTDCQFNDIFTKVITDILRLLVTQTEIEDVVAYILKYLSRLQLFMEKISDDILSSNQRAGLFGELYFLYTYLIPTIGIKDALASWYGPEKKQQDFLLSDSIGIEVKTTSAKPPVSLSITSEQQLNPKAFTALYLYHLQVTEVSGQSNTLPGLINKIYLACKDDEELRLEFTIKLLEANYRIKDKEQYSRTSYSVINESAYDVKMEGFPSITPEKLQPGVGNVRYSIQVGVLEPFRINIDYIIVAISEGV